MRAILKHIATLGPVGYVPAAPGTFGTLAALGFVLVLEPSGHLHAVIAAAMAVGGAYAAGSAEASLGQKDSGHIVIDEFAGYLLATAYLPRTPFYLLSSFILFRIFDILKPPPVNWLQGIRGGPGVMADDLAAGVMANVLLQLWKFLR